MLIQISLISDIRNNYPIKVNVGTDQEDVANIFQKYRSIVLPVVDDLDIILGVITIDDVVDVVVEEATEDILKLSGHPVMISKTINCFKGSIFYALIHRMPWLFVTILGGMIASLIMIFYSERLDVKTISLSFILSYVPLLMGLGGQYWQPIRDHFSANIGFGKRGSAFENCTQRNIHRANYWQHYWRGCWALCFICCAA